MDCLTASTDLETLDAGFNAAMKYVWTPENKERIEQCHGAGDRGVLFDADKIPQDQERVRGDPS